MRTWLLLLAMAIGLAAEPKGKPHQLKGKITAVGKDRVTVNHGNVEGFMGAMTMPYKVDKVEVLTKVKVGDQIEATVYEEDFTLYDMRVIAATKK
jgi:Cu/Ag efflux protein CusF